MTNAGLPDTTTLFSGVVPPDPQLFYRRDDPKDPRLGERIGAGAAAYAEAQVVILGCPQDEGVRRNRGRPGAASAPAEIRRFLTRLTVARVEHLRICDLGDTLTDGTLEEIHARQRAIVRRVIADGKRLVVLGGGNDISYPDCAGLADASESVLALNVDAHFDVRLDTPRNSGTPYRQLLAERLVAPESFFEVGGLPFVNSPAYEAWLRERGAGIVWLDQLRAAGIAASLHSILAGSAATSIFWGLDMDVVCAADAPGVSAPNPLGLRGEELCRIAALAGAEPRTRLLEISEANPDYDLDGRTCRLAAAAIWHFLAAIDDGR
jgi:formiminoglutamase